MSMEACQLNVILSMKKPVILRFRNKTVMKCLEVPRLAAIKNFAVPQSGKVMLILILTPKPLFFSMGYLKSKLCMVEEGGGRGEPEVLIKQWFWLEEYA